MPAKRWPEECNVGSNNTKFLFADRTRYISHLDNIAVPSGAPLFVVFYGEDHISDRGPEVVLNSQLAHALHFHSRPFILSASHALARTFVPIFRHKLNMPLVADDPALSSQMWWGPCTVKVTCYTVEIIVIL